MADVNDLSKLVMILVMIGLILGIGILVLAKFGSAVADSTDVVNETITISSNTGTVANIDQKVTAVTTFGNASTTLDSYIDTNITWTAAGLITIDLGAPFEDDDYVVSYTYDKNATATETTSSTIAALTPIASDWLPLIVTVAVLAIILTLVLSSFAVRTR